MQKSYSRWETFEIGSRVLHYVRSDNMYDIVENSSSILPEGSKAGFIFEFGNGVIFHRDDIAVWQIYIRQDGCEFNLGVNNGTTPISPADEAGLYVLYIHHDTKLAVYDTDMDERWTLSKDSDVEIRDALVDVTYLYSVSQRDNQHSVWQINCDEDGRPIGLTLLTEDICG